ncbi:BTB/POZ domain-containing protein 6-like [Amblyomma americanum]
MYVIHKYLYSGKLQVESVLQAASIRTAAEKFMVPELANKCLEYVMRRMGPADVCKYLDYLLTMGEQGFVLPASKVISANSLAVLSSSAFESCLEGTVNYILDHLTNVDEVSVLEAVYAWGNKQCSARCVARGRPYNIREVLLPLFPKLRFLALTVHEFVARQNAWGIFSADEAYAIMSNIVSPGSWPMPSGFCTIRTPRMPGGVEFGQTFEYSFGSPSPNAKLNFMCLLDQNVAPSIETSDITCGPP